MEPAEDPVLAPGASAEALLYAGDLLDAGVLTVDAALVIRGWNRWLEAVTGWTAASTVGRPLPALFPDAEGGRAERAFLRALSGETVVLSHRFHEFLLPFPPGPAFPGYERMQQSARIAPIFAGGRVVGAVAIIQDVTERVAREAELRAAIEQAENASEAKSEFMAGLSHELRTPLGAILGYSDLLETEVVGPLSGQQKDFMRRVKAGARHLMGIIEEILSFSRVEAGREELHYERVDPAGLAREAIALVEPQAAEKGLTLRTYFPDAPLEATSDPGKLRQILVNLLGNAVKFTDAGEVEMRCWTEPGTVCFSVRDTGPGIAAADLDRIFEPFMRAEAPAGATPKGGTGLGLPVSRRLARLLGGELEVESDPGAGSRFTLTLPLDPPLRGAD